MTGESLKYIFLNFYSKEKRIVNIVKKKNKS